MVISTLASSFQAFFLTFIPLPGVLEIRQLRQNNLSVNVCTAVHRNATFPA